MTLTEISRYFHLNEAIQKNREALKFLRERAEPAAPSLNGMPLSLIHISEPTRPY